jgi:hypothetical protein
VRCFSDISPNSDLRVVFTVTPDSVVHFRWSSQISIGLIGPGTSQQPRHSEYGFFFRRLTRTMPLRVNSRALKDTDRVYLSQLQIIFLSQMCGFFRSHTTSARRYLTFLMRMPISGSPKFDDRIDAQDTFCLKLDRRVEENSETAATSKRQRN